MLLTSDNKHPIMCFMSKESLVSHEKPNDLVSALDHKQSERRRGFTNVMKVGLGMIGAGVILMGAGIPLFVLTSGVAAGVGAGLAYTGYISAGVGFYPAVIGGIGRVANPEPKGVHSK
jgi:hypothetical protein